VGKIVTQTLYTVSRVAKNLHPKQDLDPFSRVCTLKPRDRQTDRRPGSLIAIVHTSNIRCGLIIMQINLQTEESCSCTEQNLQRFYFLEIQTMAKLWMGRYHCNQKVSNNIVFLEISMYMSCNFTLLTSACIASIYFLLQ